MTKRERVQATREAFDRATNGACRGADGEMDPQLVAHWQVDHGVPADGRVGPLTVAAANCEERLKAILPALAAQGLTVVATRELDRWQQDSATLQRRPSPYDYYP